VLGPKVSVFGAGADGGDEATFEGRMHSRAAPAVGRLRVVQAKFKQRPAGDGKDAAWVLRQPQAELETWANPKSNRVRRGRVPQHVLFTTNVVPSAVAGSGGIDRVEALIARYADRLGLKGWRCDTTTSCAACLTCTPGSHGRGARRPGRALFEQIARRLEELDREQQTKLAELRAVVAERPDADAQSVELLELLPLVTAERLAAAPEPLLRALFERFQLQVRTTSCRTGRPSGSRSATTAWTACWLRWTTSRVEQCDKI
jgi:hypothetical protein